MVSLLRPAEFVMDVPYAQKVVEFVPLETLSPPFRQLLWDKEDRLWIVTCSAVAVLEVRAVPYLLGVQPLETEAHRALASEEGVLVACSEGLYWARWENEAIRWEQAGATSEPVVDLSFSGEGYLLLWPQKVVHWEGGHDSTSRRLAILQNGH